MEAKKKKATKGSKFFSDSIPVDLMIEIFRRLPVKTLTRLISVSKLWASVIRNRDFMNLFLQESLNKPRGLVLIFRLDQVSNLSSEHPRFKTHESSSSSASLAIYHVTCLARQDTFIAPSSVHGLICYTSRSTLGIYNPCTRRSIKLPKLNSERTHVKQYLGFDPIDNDYKVLCVTRAITKPKDNPRGLAKGMWVLTLGSKSSWKRFSQDNIPRHSPISQDLCINGVLYYRAFTGSELDNSAIMSFDVRSERLHLIKAEKLDITIRSRRIFRNFSKLTCYEGKLAVIFVEIESIRNIVLWVLEDAAREEWSRKAFLLPTLPQEPCLDTYQKFRSTDTNTGELIFSGMRSKLDCVAYYDVKENRSRRVYIEGKECLCSDSELLSSGQVENLMFL